MQRISWWKEDTTPIWWPPKCDDLYDSQEPAIIKASKAFGGWLAFVICFGPAVFLYIWLFKLLFLQG